MVTHSDRQVPPALDELPLVGAFPEQAVEFTHALHGDDRMSLASIAELADRLPRRSVVYDTAEQSLLAPKAGPPRGQLDHPGDVIRDLEDANAWLTLLNVEDDPAYADLMNTMLDQLEASMGWRQGKMRNRAAFLLASSPNSVTPVHFDIEHSLLMQVNGSKRLSIGRFESEAACRHEIDRYWDGSHGRIEALPEEVRSYAMVPGVGVYIPPAVPHWVHNGPAISASITFTYFTTATLRQNRIEHLNSRLRRLHMTPRPPGQSAPVDAVKSAVVGAWGLTKPVRVGMANARSRGAPHPQG